MFALQNQTEPLVTALCELLPDHALNPWFLEIVNEGTGKTFSMEQNADWPRHTRPILEAFFHARFFVEMAVRYSDLPEPPSPPVEQVAPSQELCPLVDRSEPRLARLRAQATRNRTEVIRGSQSLR